MHDDALVFKRNSCRKLDRVLTRLYVKLDLSVLREALETVEEANKDYSLEYEYQ